LINQSPVPLTNGAIELLCLGLNFIPSRINPHVSLVASIDRLTREIDTTIFFFKKTNHKFTRKGWLAQYTQKNWKPAPQTWKNNFQITTILESLTNPDLNLSPISHDKLSAEILQLQKRKDIHILKSDKGRNTVIWPVKEYDIKASRQLSDKNTYHELTKNEYDDKLKDIKNQCCEISENLLALGLITPIEDDEICKRAPTGSAIYFLPKIHKNMEKTSKTFPGRPIVATFTSVTYLLDKYITELTGHLLKRIPGSLIDTHDFISRLPTGPLSAGSQLVTADVTSLYPSIPWTDGINASTDFYSENLQFLTTYASGKNMCPPPKPKLFKRILTLILSNSMIHFKEKRFFHQIKGTAMGCCISVYFANCYMFAVTRPLVLSPPTWLICFLRFIDDLFFIICNPNQQDFLAAVNSISNHNIGYEIVDPAKTQNFLDTTVSIKKDRIILEPYSKETASGSYLHPSSTHPYHTVMATPYSQLLRIRRISSNKFIFRKHAKKMKMDFRNMGYSKKLLKNTFNKIFNLSEAELALTKSFSPTARSFKFITNFNHTFNWKKVQLILNKLHVKITQHYTEGPYQDLAIAEHLQDKQIKIVFSNEKNISSFFSSNVKH
jgi:hypothetical protein